jgi:hypothetical protein
MSEMDVRRVRCNGEGTSRLLLLVSTEDATGNFTAAVVGELRNIDCGRGRDVATPADAEAGGPASRPLADCLRCLGEFRAVEERSCLAKIESLDIDGVMSGDGEVERGFGD